MMGLTVVGVDDTERTREKNIKKVRKEESSRGSEMKH